MVEASDDRPSSARRKQLREADATSGTIPTVSNFFPLERYYDASDKVLETFVTAFEQRHLDEAYVYGMRYCTFCVERVKKHDYYYSTKYESRRKETNERVMKVLNKLEKVAELMDTEEVEKEKKRQAFLKKQQEENLRKRREEEQRRLQDLQKRIAQQKLGSESKSTDVETSVEESALAKLQRLSGPLDAPATTPVKETTLEDQLDPAGHHADSPNNDIQPLPPPMLPPSEPPSYQSLEPHDESNPPTYHSLELNDENSPPSYQSLAQNDYFGPGAIQPPPATPSYDSIIKKKKPEQPKRKKLSIRQYIAYARKHHAQFQQERKIVVGPLRTYQGKCNGSTNGCTVISACVVSKHLQTEGGVTDSQIASVIDKECVPLLRAIRSKLGLGGSSLIIPSDVHDHLVDHKWLYQHKFVGATGGNICDISHLGELLSLLKGEPGKTQHLKAGATLFFREHVISIVKFPTSPTEAIYDMVDSLPVCNGRASRTRCMSLEALQVHLEWYSSHKFSDGNCTYIERNRWSDAMADFDPRVFQAFVWADKPQSKT